MITAKELNALVQLAEASYTLFDAAPAVASGDDAGLIAALKDKINREGEFSPAQAQALAGDWSLVDHLPDTTSGFSATLFASKSNSSDLVLAIRGTEFDRSIPEWIRDVHVSDLNGVIVEGLAVGQIVDLYNYWKELAAPSGSTVRLARIVETTDSNASGIFAQGVTQPETGVAVYERVEFFNAPSAGLGKATGTISSLRITGHSLGGHLATAFQRLFSNSVPAEVVTVNGMGTGQNAVVNAFFDALAERSGTTFDASRIANVYGAAGPNFATGELLYTQYGDRPQVYTESFGPGAKLGHGASQMSDTAAVYDLFLRADIALATSTPLAAAATLLDVFKAASSTANFTLESVVNVFGKIFVPSFVPMELKLEGDREALYQRVASIRSQIPPNGLTVTSLVGMSTSELIVRAQAANGLAYRYALKELNPFAVLGPNSLYDGSGAFPSKNANGELNPYADSATTPAGMTADYIADRAQMLAFLNTSKTNDSKAFGSNLVTGQVLYQDLVKQFDGKGTDVLVFLPGGTPNFNGPNTRVIEFGTNAAEELKGRGNADDLYGSGGADVLTGNAGNDYLEGGAGIDWYQFVSGDGQDTILDTDGKGKLIRNGETISLGLQDDATHWSLEGTTFTKSGTDLTLSFIGGTDTITIKDFDFTKAKDKGYLGIRLPDAGAVNPPDVFAGNAQNNSIAAVASQQAGFVDVYVDSSSPVTVPLGAGLTLSGLGGADFIFGHAGDDALYGGSASDLLDIDAMAATGDRGDYLNGGAGDDLLVGAGGNDLLVGGTGDDSYLGSAGDDYLNDDLVATVSSNWFIETTSNPFAPILHNVSGTIAPTNGDGADVMLGGAGNDWMFAGAGNDTVLGEDGNDVIGGGGGDDFIYGGAGDDWVSSDAPYRYPDPVTGNYVEVGNDYVDGGEGNDHIYGLRGNDTLLGGAGDDILYGDQAFGDASTPPLAEHGNDYLDGGDGNDQLYGDGGDDILIGGKGDDYIDGGTGNNTFVYNPGDGNDTIVSQGKGNSLSFSGVALANMSFRVVVDGESSTGQSLVIDYGPGDRITMRGWSLGSAPTLSFDTGETMSMADAIASQGNLTVTGSGEGFGPSVTMTGGEGDNLLIGGIGDNTYVYNLGDGTDSIVDFGGTDTVAFGAGITPDDVGFTMADVNQYGDAVPAQFAVTVNGDLAMWVYDGEFGTIERYRFDDGTVLTHADMLARLGGAMDVPDPDPTPIVADQFTSASLVLGGPGNDLFGSNGALAQGQLGILGAGDDRVGLSDDESARVAFNLGDGHDTLLFNGSARYDTVYFGAGITPESIRTHIDTYDVLIAGSGQTVTWRDLVVDYGDRGDTLTVNLNTTSQGKVGRFVFADGQEFSTGELMALNSESAAFASEPAPVASGDGDDFLAGTRVADTLAGGLGNDVLSGGPGDDTYVFNLGDGVDTINDISQPGAGNGIVFGEGIASDDISLGIDAGALVLKVGGQGDEIHLSRFDQFDLYGSARTVDRLSFSDGSQLAYADLFARGFDITGTEGDDFIESTEVADRIQALGGNDTIYAGSGDDTVDGGAGDDFLVGDTGNDLLIGGAGNDTYYITNGGRDTIDNFEADPQAVDTLTFDAATAPGDLSFARSGSDLVLATALGDSVTLKNWYLAGYKLDSVTFDYDGTVWDAATLQALAPPGPVENVAPVVSASDAVLLLSESADASSLFAVTDANGDTPVQYEFWDSTTGNGHFSVGGVEAGVNVSIPVTAAELATTTFTASDAIGSDLVWVRANDGQAWSDWKSWTVYSSPHLTNALPVVTAANGELLLGTSTAASSLFSASDADSDPIVQYQFWDDVEGGGYFRLNGVQQAAGRNIYVAAADLANTEYVAGTEPGTEQVWVRASDGIGWGAWKNWNMTSALHIPNAAPEISATTATLTLGSVAQAASLFSVSDADADPIERYEFWDSGAGGGHFEIAGVEQGVNVAIPVTAVELADTTFRAASSTASDLVWVRASDGQEWGDWKSWTVNSWPHLGNHAPEASASDATLLTGEVAAASSLFSVQDADGDAATQYQFWDDVNGGGYWRVNGVQQAAAQNIDVSAADLANTEYVAGATGGTERVWVRANDGLEWGAWKPWNMTTALHVPNAAPVVSAQASQTILLNGTEQASALFSVTDADNDAITQYEFWDSTGGTGHFEISGAEQGVNVAIPVSAAQLADTTFKAGQASGSDLVWVRANDGQVWSDWKSWTMQSSPHLTNAAPVVSAANAGLLANESVAASSLFSVSDADGDAIAQYQFWDDVNGGGRFELGGMQQAAGANIDVTAAQLAQLTYEGGANAGTEQVWVRANDGTAWGAWKNWLMSTEGGMLRGGTGPDTLNGDPATPVLEGGGGNDTLNAGGAASLLSGGAGDDALNGGAGNDLIAGGAGDDQIDTGAGSNVVAFNRGDGADAVGSAAGASNTVSLGNGIGYDDLSLSKDGADLVLDAGGGDSLRLKDWYDGKDTLDKLQLVIDATAGYDAGSADPLLNKRVQTFDFKGMVAQFDQALAQSPGLTSWALTNALLDFHLSGSDDAAVGGDLAYWYGRNAGFTGIGLASALQTLSAQGFGADAQSLHAFGGLQEGLVKLA